MPHLRLPMSCCVLENPMVDQNPARRWLSAGNSTVENSMRRSSESSETAYMTKWFTIYCVYMVLSVGIYGVGNVYPVTNSRPDWKIMGNDTEVRDSLLVKECLSGSEKAWNEFYCRFVGLVRSIVRRQPAIKFQDMDDVIQSVFTALIKGLKDYQRGFPLARFVCMVAERVCIQEYRRVIAAKRDGETDPIDHHETGKENAKILHSEIVSQEELLERSQLLDFVRRSLRSLGAGCQELLRLRYFEELSYKEITKMLGVTENTLTVRARRCLDDLAGHYYELLRRGAKK